MRQLKITPSVTARTQTVEDYLLDLGRIEMVSPDEEGNLAARIKAGDDAAFKRLDEANLRFVVSVAKQCQKPWVGADGPGERGEHRPHEGSTQVRPVPGIQVHLVRRLVDPPADSPSLVRAGAHHPHTAQPGEHSQQDRARTARIPAVEGESHQ